MISPIFYSRFKCIANACKHSCCCGWEIDVDEDTVDYYRGIDGDLGKKLDENIICENDEYHFRLTEEERCPFLRQDGLCEIILDLGEDGLCDICALHPRFYFFCKPDQSIKKISDQEETDPSEDQEILDEIEFGGLGLSCEEVTRLLLSESRPLLFIDDSETTFGLSRILTMLGSDPNAIKEYKPDVSEKRIDRILKIFSKTEPIDDDWTRMMDELHTNMSIGEKCSEKIKDFDALKYQRIHDYILYRQLERLPDNEIKTLADYAEACCDFIFICSSVYGDLAESVRRFSEQVEYSTENVDIIIDSL